MIYISMDTSSLSDIGLASTFSHSAGFLSTFFMVSFGAWKFLTTVKSNLSVLLSCVVFYFLLYKHRVAQW